MVRAARRAYSDATRWIRAGRPPTFNPRRFALRATAGAFVGGTIVLGAFGLLTPARFGATGARAFRSGWPALALLALVAAAVLLVLIDARRLRWLVARVREPWRRPLDDDPNFAGAVEALASCPAALHTRFVASYVWGPAVLGVLGTMFGFSSAYFVVDAILARFSVGWEQPLLAVGNALLSVIVFWAASQRLSTWRLAASVHREVATGYPS